MGGTSKKTVIKSFVVDKKKAASECRFQWVNGFIEMDYKK